MQNLNSINPISNKLVSGLLLGFLLSLNVLQGCSTAPSYNSKTHPDGLPPTKHMPQNLHLIPDAKPKVEPLSKYGNRFKKNNTYVEKKKRYKVLPTSRGYREKGLASWYGRKFHGRRTSSGERYDMFAMTAAHKTLPLPTYARVTNLENGKSVVVKINDRGPFHKNRVIDLSYVAAHKLGIAGKGTGRVEIVSIDPRDHHGTRIPRASAPIVLASSKTSPEMLEPREPLRARRSTKSTALPTAALPTAQTQNNPIAKRSSSSSQNSVIIERRGEGTIERPEVVRARPGTGNAIANENATANITAAKTITLATASPATAKKTSAENQTASKKPNPKNPNPKNKSSTIANNNLPAQTNVKTQAPVKTATPPEKISKPSRFYLQLGSYKDKKLAQDLVNKVSKLSQLSAQILESKQKQAALFRVRIGPLNSEEEAVRVTQKLAAVKLPVANVIKE